jgi:hypothetical protein
MSVKVSAAAILAYDAVKARARSRGPRSGARDPAGIRLVEERLREWIGSGRLGGHDGQGGALYVFWTEVDALVSTGALDDLLDRL